MTFAPPDGWRDIGIALFLAGASTESGTLTVFREPLQAPSIPGHALKEAARHASSSAALRIDDATVAGRSARWLVAETAEPLPSWLSTVFIEDGEESAVVLSMRSPSPLAATLRPIFARVIESVRFDPPAPTSSEVSSSRGGRPPERVDMTRYHHKGFSFEPPPTWTDLTLAAYVAPAGPEGPSTTITVAREPVARSEPLRTHADRQIVKLGRMVPDFDIQESTPMVIGGREALQLRFRFSDGGKTMEQRTVMVAAGDEPVRKITIFMMAGPAERAPDEGRVFAHLLTSVRFDGPLGAEAHEPQGRTTNPPPQAALPLLPSVPMPGRRDR